MSDYGKAISLLLDQEISHYRHRYPSALLVSDLSCLQRHAKTTDQEKRRVKPSFAVS